MTVKRLALLSTLLLSACVTPPPAEVPQRRAIAAEVMPNTRGMNSFAVQPGSRV
jgi:starvation-inducible outer membrane lipoprotein